MPEMRHQLPCSHPRLGTWSCTPLPCLPRDPLPYRAVLAWCACMQFSPSVLDAKAYSTLASLPADDQASALRQFFTTNLAAMKNPSAYLLGVVRSIRGSGGRRDAPQRGSNGPVAKQLDFMYRKCGAAFATPALSWPVCAACCALRLPSLHALALAGTAARANASDGWIARLAGAGLCLHACAPQHKACMCDFPLQDRPTRRAPLVAEPGRAVCGTSAA